jgi:hypothetical protein
MKHKEIITYKGFEFEYNYYYQPEERQTHDYPGCDEEFEITNITLNGIDASELLESQIEEFEQEVIDNITNRNH